MKKRFSKEINLLLEKFVTGDLRPEEISHLENFLNSTPGLKEKIASLSFINTELKNFAKNYPDKISRIEKDKTIIPVRYKNNISLFSSVRKIGAKLPSFYSQTVLWPAALAAILLFGVAVYRVKDTFFEQGMNSHITSVEGTCDSPGVAMKSGDNANGRVIYSGTNSYCEISFKGKYSVTVKLFSQTVIKNTIRGNSLDISLASGEMMVEAENLPNPEEFTVYVKGHALNVYGSKVLIVANDNSVDFDVIQGKARVKKSNLYLMERIGSQLTDSEREILKERFPDIFSESEKLLTIGNNFNSPVNKSAISLKEELFEQVEGILIYEKESAQNREIAMGSLDKVKEVLSNSGHVVAENSSQEPTPNKFKDLSRISRKSESSADDNTDFSITFKLTMKNGELYFGALKEQKESYFVSTNQGTRELRKSEVKRIELP